MLEDGQFSYRGLVFGAGTRYRIKSLEGLEDMAIRDGDRVLPRGHGAVPGPHYVDVKEPVFELVVRDEGGTLPEDLAALAAAFTVAETDAIELTFKRPGRPERFVWARPLAYNHPESAPTVGVVANPKIALKLADPRIYATELQQANLAKFNPSGPGLDYPEVDYPKEFPDPAAGVLVTNDGSSDAYPLVRFYGPTDGGTLTSVTLRNVTTGQVQTVVTPVAVGQVLTVDNEAHVTGSGKQVVGLDGSTRYGSWQQPRTPFRLPPGPSELRYETVGSTAATVCVVTWRDTWIP